MPLEIIKNIRVLIYLNPLVVDKISKKFLYQKDSGFLYTKQLIETLPKNWHISILVPDGIDQSFFPNCKFIKYDYSTSIHQNRYHFNRNILAKSFPYGKDIDVVLNMQPEVSANLSVFFQNQRRETPIIINYFHWIDCDESRKFAKNLGGYISRQIDGVMTADLSLFHSEYALSLFNKSVKQFGINDLKFSSGFFKPKSTNFGTVPFDLPNKKIILFNHRLNNTSGWKEVVNIFKELGRDDCVLWITDDQNLKESKLNNDLNIIVKRVDYDNYGYLLQKSHFSIANLGGYSTWNMSVIDSINHGTAVISPKTDLMQSIGANTTINLKDTILQYIKMDKVTPPLIEFNDFDIPKWITNKIESTVSTACKPKKYDEVVSMLPCEKRQFINNLWSFHANSNFQKIRWRLLCEGFEDTLSDYTFYTNKVTPI